MWITVTQFMLPDGRQEMQLTQVADEHQDAYVAMQAAGCRIEAEVLSTGEVSLTVACVDVGEDLGTRIVPNGPQVVDALHSLLTERSWERKKWTIDAGLSVVLAEALLPVVEPIPAPFEFSNATIQFGDSKPMPISEITMARIPSQCKVATIEMPAEAGKRLVEKLAAGPQFDPTGTMRFVACEWLADFTGDDGSARCRYKVAVELYDV